MTKEELASKVDRLELERAYFLAQLDTLEEKKKIYQRLIEKIDIELKKLRS